MDCAPMSQVRAKRNEFFERTISICMLHSATYTINTVSYTQFPTRDPSIWHAFAQRCLSTRLGNSSLILKLCTALHTCQVWLLEQSSSHECRHHTVLTCRTSPWEMPPAEDTLPLGDNRVSRLLKSSRHSNICHGRASGDQPCESTSAHTVRKSGHLSAGPQQNTVLSPSQPCAAQQLPPRNNKGGLRRQRQHLQQAESAACKGGHAAQSTSRKRLMRTRRGAAAHPGSPGRGSRQSLTWTGSGCASARASARRAAPLLPASRPAAQSLSPAWPAACAAGRPRPSWAAHAP